MNSQSKFYRRNLPHYFIPEACYFITYRLANSLPVQKLQLLKNEYEQVCKEIKLQKLSKIEIDKKITNEWKKYFDRIDNLLHQNSGGPKYLEQTQIADIIAESLKFFDANDYDLISYCIMPNHVHCVLKLNEGSRSLDKIMQSVKRYSASESNKLLNRKGQFWQHENYDHIVRDEKELEGIIEYILNNPVKAGLVKCKEDWEWNYCKLLL